MSQTSGCDMTTAVLRPSDMHSEVQTEADGESLNDSDLSATFNNLPAIFSDLTDRDTDLADNDDDMAQSAMDEVWDVTSVSHPDETTPNTSSIDESPTAPDEMDELGNGDDEYDEPEPLKYHLRPQSRELKSAFMRTWIDQDETGNYGEKGPNEGTRRARPRRQPVKFRLRDDFHQKSDETDDGEAGDESSAKIISKLMVTLSFQSEAGKNQYECLSSSLASEPKTDYDVNFNGYRLRKRGQSLAAHSPSASDFPDDLTGHPVARGCYECLAIGLRCSLLDDERAWPCTTCAADNQDCDLVTPAEIKRACERCKSRKTSCSYNYTEKHSEPCQQCMDDGYHCVAGPAKDHIRVRIRYDRDWVNDPAPKQKPFKARKHPNSDETPGQCKLDDFLTKSTQKRAEQKDSSPRHESKRRLSAPPATAQRPTKIPRTADKSEGTTTTIETKFCHPIIFNHEETPGGERCHFCSEPSYPIVGLAAKEVEVIEWEDGRGLEEIGGGHKGEGVESTRVCISCTTDRMSTILCKTHELRQLDGSENDSFEVNEAFDQLISGSGRLKGKWCAICANLAGYECCSAGEGQDGCGLLVCEHCMVQLTGIYDGDLQKMLPELIDEVSEDRVFGLRADYELLKEDGLLMRYVLWSTQQ